MTRIETAEASRRDGVGPRPAVVFEVPGLLPVTEISRRELAVAGGVLVVGIGIGIGAMVIAR